MKKIFKRSPRLKNVLCVGLLLMAGLPGSSQPVIQADVSIASIIITQDVGKREGSTTDAKVSFSNLKCTIRVHNEGGYANQTMLVVQLPAGITVVSNSNNSTEYRSGNGNRGGWPGALLINLHNIAGGQDAEIEFTITRSSSANTIAAYVFSGCSDPKPANNFKEANY